MPTDDAPDAGSRAILVVDDEEVVRDYLTTVLELEGYQVDAVGDGRAALEYVSKYPVDLLLVDWLMPGMNGRELHEELSRQDHPLAERMVVMSGNTHDERVIDFLKKTGTTAIQKPFRAADVQQIVVKLLDDSSPPGE